MNKRKAIDNIMCDIYLMAERIYKLEEYDQETIKDFIKKTQTKIKLLKGIINYEQHN